MAIRPGRSWFASTPAHVERLGRSAAVPDGGDDWPELLRLKKNTRRFLGDLVSGVRRIGRRGGRIAAYDSRAVPSPSGAAGSTQRLRYPGGRRGLTQATTESRDGGSALVSSRTPSPLHKAVRSMRRKAFALGLFVFDDGRLGHGIRFDPPVSNDDSASTS
jgi:hypothetical protein